MDPAPTITAMAKGKQFRSELYYRLSVFPIDVPLLRKRSEDIPLLTIHFLYFYGMKFGKTVQGMPKNDMARLVEYPCPGNVREFATTEISVLISYK